MALGLNNVLGLTNGLGVDNLGGLTNGVGVDSLGVDSVLGLTNGLGVDNLGGLTNGLGVDSLGVDSVLGLTNGLGVDNQSLLGVVHTYDSGGQLPVPGVILGTEDINVSIAPDNDPADLGVDIAANVANGMGPQVDGEGIGAYLDLDTNSLSNGVVGIDDSDVGYGSDLAILGPSGQTADDGVLAVHLSGIGEHAVDGAGGAVDGTLGGVLNIGGLLDGGLGGLGLLNSDDV